MGPTPGGLPDHIKPGVRILFVGINPGLRSAAVGHHFAGYSNRFWKLLHESKLTPSRLTHEQDWRLPEWGFGLTNIVARPSRGIDALTPRDYAAGRRQLVVKIRRYRPQIVALLGVTLLPVVCPPSPTRIARIPPISPSSPSHISRLSRLSRRLGLQPDTLAGAKVFVLPNPSGRNAHYSYEQMLKAFRRLRRLVAVLALCLILQAGCVRARQFPPPPSAHPSASAIAPGDYTRELPGWSKRPYDLHVPANYDRSGLLPVVLALHGGGSNSRGMARLTCPEGNLKSPQCLNHLADREGSLEICRPAGGVAVLQIHGTEDPAWPFQGGASKWKADQGRKVSVGGTMRGWAKRNGCGLSPRVETMPTTPKAEEETAVRREEYTGCPSGAAVVLYAVEGGGHTWPRGWQYFPESKIGKTAQALSANAVIWTFLSAQRRL